ncbi:DUF1122 family protein [Hydrogenobacter hydrogenophilus]|uniref:DUF1122 domain-containing protein n=1 Tax=Hydrogenobacter hydrogenophilus TaxID=35835 RepID=A0A285P3H3_9AQUI|nr:DUF1122 family protein [Hydrogenobacter hydrogenophilus]SNZ14421.1 Protein of unknown function [Hydrogenobacter hydrogenophilus]
MRHFESFLNALTQGIKHEGKRLYLSKREGGRFVEEENLTLEIDGKRLMFAKVFYGRKPYWKEWIELFHIEPSFFSSPFEDKLYELISEHFGRIFVEYYEDKQTSLELQRGVPPEETRLGKKLIEHGYKHLKNWYFPEGWMEGGYKLQGEKGL